MLRNAALREFNNKRFSVIDINNGMKMMRHFGSSYWSKRPAVNVR
jgi:hypothetical protein